MKTKELIKQLQKEDPSGENECVVGNVDILFVSREPSYYDGPCEILIRDENIPFCNVVGAKIQSNGEKIQIHTHSVEDAINENEKFPVDLSELRNGRLERWGKRVALMRDESKKSKQEVNEWFINKLENYYSEYIKSGCDKKILEKCFGSWLNNINRREDVKEFIEGKSRTDRFTKEFLEKKMATWIGPAWWEKEKSKKTEECKFESLPKKPLSLIHR